MKDLPYLSKWKKDLFRLKEMCEDTKKHELQKQFPQVSRFESELWKDFWKVVYIWMLQNCKNLISLNFHHLCGTLDNPFLRNGFGFILLRNNVSLKCVLNMSFVLENQRDLLFHIHALKKINLIFKRWEHSQGFSLKKVLRLIK